MRVSFNAPRSGPGAFLGNGYEIYGSKAVLRGFGTLGQRSNNIQSPVKTRLELDYGWECREILPDATDSMYSKVINDHAASIQKGEFTVPESGLRNILICELAHQSAVNNGKIVNLPPNIKRFEKEKDFCKMSKLAVYGGPKVFNDNEVKNWPPIDESDEKMVLNALHAECQTRGKHNLALEKEFCDYNGNEHAVFTQQRYGGSSHVYCRLWNRSRRPCSCYRLFMELKRHLYPASRCHPGFC